MDVLKALAFGASGVSVGRAVIAGLVASGAAGVEKVIKDITEELRWGMCLTGSKDIDHIDLSLIWDKNRK